MALVDYQLNEAHFSLPAPDVHDATVNVLTFPRLGTTLIVNRGTLADGETLQSNFNGQLMQLQEQDKELRFQPARVMKVSLAQNVEALEVQNQFSKGQETVYQYQLAVSVPGSRQMLSLSYLKSQPLGAAEAEHWAKIKKSLTFKVTV